MTDIVERLRDITPKGRDVSEYHQDDLLILQAADEIERLREALREYVATVVCEEGVAFIDRMPLG